MITFLVALGGCVWVPLSEEAKRVDLARSADEIEGCDALGVITGRTKSDVGFIPRSDGAISHELESLAKNEAVDMGANTIFAEGEPSETGSQKFRAYRCAGS